MIIMGRGSMFMKVRDGLILYGCYRYAYINYPFFARMLVPVVLVYFKMMSFRTLTTMFIYKFEHASPCRTEFFH